MSSTLASGDARKRTQSREQRGVHSNTNVDNKGDKNLAIMIVKCIGGCLNKITVTRLDVMCVFREEGQACEQEEGDVCQRKSKLQKTSSANARTTPE